MVNSVADDVNDRYRRITEALYECLAGDGKCRFRFFFGSSSFCNWILEHHNEFPAKKPPCC